MAGKTKANTKKELEKKIAELEGKLTKLSTQIKAKPAPEHAKPKPAKAKPAETKPAEKPADTTKPKSTHPKETQQLAEAPKPAPEHPVTVQEALENAYYTAPMSDFHQYRARVTGYSPAPNRYFVRLTAPVGKVPTTNWNDQKITVTGYTAPSNQYFATRQRLAYHPADKTFGSFSGINMTVDGVVAQVQTQQAPPPKPVKGTLPKGAGQAPPPQHSTHVADEAKSREAKLAEYEADYMKRLEQQKIDDEKAYQELLEAEVKARAAHTRGTLPRGFEAKPEETKPKESKPEASKGTLPKGF